MNTLLKLFEIADYVSIGDNFITNCEITRFHDRVVVYDLHEDLKYTFTMDEINNASRCNDAWLLGVNSIYNDGIEYSSYETQITFFGIQILN